MANLLVKRRRPGAGGSLSKVAGAACHDPDVRQKLPPDTFRERIVLLMDVLQIASARTLSTELGLSPSGLSAAMRSGGCTMATLEALHRLTGVDLHWLVCREGDMGPVSLRSPLKSESDEIARRTKAPKRTKGAKGGGLAPPNTSAAKKPR